jgi:hypothetical protein
MLELRLKKNCPDVRNTKIVDVIAVLYRLWNNHHL